MVPVVLGITGLAPDGMASALDAPIPVLGAVAPLVEAEEAPPGPCVGSGSVLAGLVLDG